jgi:hypothetical protein
MDSRSGTFLEHGHAISERKCRLSGTSYALACLALLAAAAAAGCRKDGIAPVAPPPPSSSAIETAADTHPKKQTYKDEVYGDPELFKEPRLQFIWAPPGEERDTIWSMKLDGSDLRRAAGSEVLYAGDVQRILSSSAPIRSPDGRYIACAAEDANDDELQVLLDLKARKTRTLFKGRGHAHFTWTPDSRQLVFYAEIKLWQFDVESSSLTRLPMIYSQGLLLVEGGTQFVAVGDRAIEHYSRSGKLLRSIALPFAPDWKLHAASSDGRTFLLQVGTQSVIVTANTSVHELMRDDVFRPHAVFGPDNRTLYYSPGSPTMALDVASGRERQIAWLTHPGPLGLSLVAVRSEQ